MHRSWLWKHVVLAAHCALNTMRTTVQFSCFAILQVYLTSSMPTCLSILRLGCNMFNILPLQVDPVTWTARTRLITRPARQSWILTQKIRRDSWTRGWENWTVWLWWVGGPEVAVGYTGSGKEIPADYLRDTLAIVTSFTFICVGCLVMSMRLRYINTVCFEETLSKIVLLLSKVSCRNFSIRLPRKFQWWVLYKWFC